MFAQLEKNETTYYAICVGEAVKTKMRSFITARRDKSPPGASSLFHQVQAGQLVRALSPDILGAAIAIRLH